MKSIGQEAAEKWYELPYRDTETDLASIIDKIVADRNLASETPDSVGAKEGNETDELVDGIKEALKVVDNEIAGLGDIYDSDTCEMLRQASLGMFNKIANPLRNALKLHELRTSLTTKS